MDTMSNKFDFILQCNRLSWASNVKYMLKIWFLVAVWQMKWRTSKKCDRLLLLILLLLILLANKKFRKIHGYSSRKTCLWRENQEWLGVLPLIFQSRHYPDFPQHIWLGCFLRRKSARPGLTHGICCTANIETWYFPFLPAFSLFYTALYFTLAFYFTLTLAIGGTVWNLSFLVCRSVTVYWAFIVTRNSFAFNTVSSPLGPSPLK